MNTRTLARARFARTSAEGGGGGAPTPEQAAAKAASDATAAEAAKNKGPVEATDEETGLPLGFPKDTALTAMTVEQREAYWRNQSKVQQKKVPTNLAELQAAKAELDQIKLKQQTPAEQEIQKVRDETAAATRKEVAAESALTNLRIVLHTRGKSDAEVDGLVEFINPERFLTQDGKVDTGKVMAYADGIAPAGSGGGGRPGGLPGQGKFGQSAQDKAAGGKEEADRRWKTQPASGKSSLLPSNT
jgi:hypothetical protein